LFDINIVLFHFGMIKQV